MLRRLAVLFVLLLAAVALALSQQKRPSLSKAPEDSNDGVIRGGINLVDLLVSVRDKKGAVAANLTKDDFRILEDGTQQEIRNFTRETDLPLTIGMVVDVSGSVADEIPDERVAAQQFFSQVLRKQDQAFIISFASSADLLEDTTSSLSRLENGLDALAADRPRPRFLTDPSTPNPAIQYFQFPLPMPYPGGGGRYPGGRSRTPYPAPYPGGGGGTPPIRGGGQQNKGTVLYDAVFLASDEVLKPLTGRKTIILITDGEDHGSLVSLSEAVEATLKADTIVYSIFVKRDVFGPNGEGVLQRLSGDTGGRVFTLQKRNLDKIFKEIEDELRSQYSISYVSTNSAEDGSYRRVDVQMADKSYTARTRKGYFAVKAGADRN
jgi:VWFA-related protein